MLLCASNNVDPNFIINFISFYTGCRLLTGAILAHELMHAWLRLKGDNAILIFVFNCTVLPDFLSYFALN